MLMLRLHWHIFTTHFLRRFDTFYHVCKCTAHFFRRAFKLTHFFRVEKLACHNFSAHTSRRGKCVEKFTLANSLHSRKCAIKLCQCKGNIIYRKKRKHYQSKIATLEIQYNFVISFHRAYTEIGHLEFND